MTAARREIERKFLVTAVPLGIAAGSGVAIQQGYVAIDGEVEVRVRRIGERHLLTVKGGTGLVRLEEEMEIDARRFAALWELTAGRRVEKRRTGVPAPGDALLEVDVYAGALSGLCVAEVEFASVEASEAFAPPHWLGPEVTGDARYANRTLATAGIPVRS